MHRSTTVSDIHNRLSTLLPSLAAANEELEAERSAGTLGKRNIEDVDDAQYIEMNLGLGVLEEKEPNGTETGSSSEDGASGEQSSSSEEDVAAGEINGGGGIEKLRERQRETDVIGKLLRRKRSKAGIQVVDGG